MQAATGTSYFPSLMEVSITIAIVTSGFAVFVMAAKYLPIYEEREPNAVLEAWRPGG
jgi:Ni/Fe-hydrogenase subunit HybB-like protein